MPRSMNLPVPGTLFMLRNPLRERPSRDLSQCRFPSCVSVLFTNIQIIWKKGEGIKNRHLMFMPFRNSAVLPTRYHLDWQADPELDRGGNLSRTETNHLPHKETLREEGSGDIMSETTSFLWSTAHRREILDDSLKIPLNQWCLSMDAFRFEERENIDDWDSSSRIGFHIIGLLSGGIFMQDQ